MANWRVAAMKVTEGWPAWPQPNDEELRELARAMAKTVRFLNPDIVYAVVEDNRRMGTEWSVRLERLGIKPDHYLWENSPCAFPGVRRAGRKENDMFRGQAAASEACPLYLALDDNDYPKQLWAFVFTGKERYRRGGPEGYHFAHLLDHKTYGQRWRKELVPSDVKEPGLHGLFTSAANTVYVPSAFMRPTDFSPKLRSLFQRKALQLYGKFCRLVPPPLEMRPCEDPKNWAVCQFTWSEPVGCMDNVPNYLKFRRREMEKLFRNCERQS